MVSSKELLEKLEGRPSTLDLQLAIDWLKKQRPTSKSAQKILKKLIQRKEFEGELRWLETWIPSGSWDALRFAAWNVRGFVVYDWLIEFVKAHGEHQQAGELWD